MKGLLCKGITFRGFLALKTKKKKKSSNIIFFYLYLFAYYFILYYVLFYHLINFILYILFYFLFHFNFIWKYRFNISKIQDSKFRKHCISMVFHQHPWKEEFTELDIMKIIISSNVSFFFFLNGSGSE